MPIIEYDTYKQKGLLQGGLQLGVPLLDLAQEAGIVLLHGHLHQRGQILPLANQPCVVLQLVGGRPPSPPWR